MSRFYVAELEGYLQVVSANVRPGLTCSVLDRAHSHRVAFLVRSEDQARGLGSAGMRQRAREQAAARCAELNAEDALCG